MTNSILKSGLFQLIGLTCGIGATMSSNCLLAQENVSQCQGIQHVRAAIEKLAEYDREDGVIMEYSVEYTFNPRYNIPDQSDEYVFMAAGDQSLLTSSQYEVYTDDEVRIRTMHYSHSILVADYAKDSERKEQLMATASMLFDSLMQHASLSECTTATPDNKFITVAFEVNSEIPARLTSLINFRRAQYIVDTSSNQLVGYSFEYPNNARNRKVEFRLTRFEYADSAEGQLERYRESHFNDDDFIPPNESWTVTDVRLDR